MVTSRLFTIKQPKIGKLIRELRLTSGLTQEQFAASLGVVYSTLNRWENGHAQPSPLAIQKLEKVIQELGERGQDLLQQEQGRTRFAIALVSFPPIERTAPE